MNFQKVLFYLGESTAFEGRLPILRVPEGARIGQKLSRRGLKINVRKTVKIIKNIKILKKVNLNKVPRIPHGFDVFSCDVYKS